MSHVVCLMHVEANRATFTWSEGPASFEPYTLDRMAYKAFQDRAAKARRKLADLVKDYLIDEQDMRRSALALAEAGHDLYLAMFRPEAGQNQRAVQVRTWLEKLAQQSEVDTLEIVVESPWLLPWNVIYDQQPDEAAFLSDDENPDCWLPFWGLRYNLAGGRKVDPLRRMPLLNAPKVLMVVDPKIRDDLPEEQKKRLDDFAKRHDFKTVGSKDELENAIAAERPVLLYWLSHAEPNALVLDDEEISPENMCELLRQGDVENFGGLAFLNACQTAEGGESGSFFEAFHSVGFAGMIGTEHQTVDRFANPLGLDFLEAFLDRGEPVGAVLHKLRRQVPLGLLYGTYCPPNIRVQISKGQDSLDIRQVHVEGVALSAGSSHETATPSPLPDEPYRALAYYDREDRALFAGRDDDLERFARYLDDTATRILVLHGESGVGKSSFLRAGVIPYLEEDCLGYRFIHNRQADASAGARDSVIFVRATNDLFGQLAQALYDFCTQPYIYATPLGKPIEADLPGVLQCLIGSNVSQTSVHAALCCDLSLLGQMMSAISNCLPFTALLVIDQGEEVFTLARKPKERKQGRRALDMLRQTVAASGDFKVIFCLRTEYYGRVIDRLRRGLHDTGGIREYLLTDFDEDTLFEAIQRPTASKPIPYASDVPSEKYGFRYAEGVAEKIAHDVVSYTTLRRDSVQLLMQVICVQLYRLVQQRADKTVTSADLEQLGGNEKDMIEGAMRKHVDGLMAELLKGHPLDKKPVQKLFTKLYLKQSDGTLTTALLPADEVEKCWNGHMVFDELLRSLRDMLLLRVDSLRIDMEEERRYVSLGHDALAKIAADWDEQLSRGKRRRKMAGIIAAVSAVALLMLFLAIFAFDARDREEIAKKEAIRAGDEARIREHAALVKTLLHTQPLEGLVLAIQTTEQSRSQLGQVLPQVQSSLLSAIQVAKESNRFKAKEGWFRAVAISPDGKTIVTDGGYEKNVLLWNLDGNLISEPLEAYQDEVESVAISPDGKTIISGSEDGTVRLWDLDGNSIGEPLTGHKGRVNSVAISRKTIISGGEDGTMRLWDLKGNSIGKPLRGHEEAVNSVTISPDGKTIISGSEDGTVRLWDLKGKPIGEPLTGHKGRVNSVAISRKTIISGGEDGTMRLWDLKGNPIGEPLRGHEEAVNSVTISPDGKTIISGSEDGTVRLWDLKGNPIGEPLRGHDINVTSVAVSPDGKTIASTGGFYDSVRLWDLEDNPIRRLGEPESLVTSVTISPDGQTIVTGRYDAYQDTPGSPEPADKKVRLWDRNGRPIGLPFAGYSSDIYCMAFSPDGKTIVTGSNDQTVRLWDRQGVAIGNPFKGHQAPVRSAAFSRDGKTVVTGDEHGVVRLWDLKGISVGVSKEKHANAVTAVAISPDGKTIISSDVDTTVRWWDLKGNSIGKPFEGKKHEISAIAFSPDGQFIASGRGRGGKDKTVRLWDRNGKPVGEPFRGHRASVYAVAFSPDGQFVVSGGDDKTVRLWDRNGNPMGEPFKGHSSSVWAVAFSPDGQYIVSASEGEVGLWRAGNWSTWLQRACDRLRNHPVLIQHDLEMAPAVVEEADEKRVRTAAEICRDLRNQ